MNKQKKILNKLAEKHNIPIGHAEEIWKLFTNKVADTVSETDKMENGLYVPDNFKNIHIDNFGKFVPDLRKIGHANNALKKKDA